MLAGIFVGLMLIMRVWPQTPVARFFHVHLVERPVAWAAGFERHQLLYVFALGALLLMSAEVIAIFGSAELAMVYAFDLSLYVDAALATYMAAVVSRIQTARNWLIGHVRRWTHRVARPVSTKRVARQRRVRPKLKIASNDDEEDGSIYRLGLAA
jgi:hypothetical protein